MGVGSSLEQHLSCVLVSLPVRMVPKDIYMVWGLGVRVCEAATQLLNIKCVQCWYWRARSPVLPQLPGLILQNPELLMTKPSLLGQASQPGSHLGHLHIYGFGIHRPFLSVVLPWHVVGTSLSALAFLLRPLSTPVWCEQLWGKKAQWLAAPCGPIALLVLLTVDRTWREPS